MLRRHLLTALPALLAPWGAEELRGPRSTKPHRSCGTIAWFTRSQVCCLAALHEGDHQDARGRSFPLTLADVEDRRCFKYLEEAARMLPA